MHLSSVSRCFRSIGVRRHWSTPNSGLRGVKEGLSPIHACCGISFRQASLSLLIDRHHMLQTSWHCAHPLSLARKEWLSSSTECHSKERWVILLPKGDMEQLTRIEGPSIAISAQERTDRGSALATSLFSPTRACLEAMSQVWKHLGAACLVGLGAVSMAMASCERALSSGECLPATDDSAPQSLLQHRVRETAAGKLQVGGDLRRNESIHYVPLPQTMQSYLALDVYDMHMDLRNVVQNNLGGKGPNTSAAAAEELRYENVFPNLTTGSVDLVVTALTKYLAPLTFEVVGARPSSKKTSSLSTPSTTARM